MSRKSVISQPAPGPKPIGRPKGSKNKRAKAASDNRVIVVKTPAARIHPNSLANLQPGKNHEYDPLAVSKRKQKLARQLQDLIQEIGKEVVDEKVGWTRMEAVVRRLYSESMAGKIPAMALLFERGWGKVPAPVQLDIRAEVLGLMDSTGLTAEELENDPILKELIGRHVIDNDFQSPNGGSPESTAQQS